MFGRMFSKLLKKDQKPLVLEQPQREAIIDTLVFAMMADGEMTPEERDELDGAFDKLEWDSEFNREAFLDESIARATAATGSKDKAAAYIAEIGARLPELPTRERAYELAARIVCADREVAEAERGLMSMFIRQFQIPEARALDLDEIPRLLDDYRHAARCAARAGFDGVEVHAANGYLIDQFLRSSTNRREDEYGGSLENRLRLLDEVVAAVTEVLPAGRVGVRLSPMGGPGGSSDAKPEDTYPAAAAKLAGRGLAYLHVVRPNGHTGSGGSDEGNAIVKDMRKRFDGVFVANGEFSTEEAAQWVADGHADAIAFGRLFIANPDLPARIAAGGPYEEANEDTFYGGGAEGYVDYPTLDRVTDPLPVPA